MCTHHRRKPPGGLGAQQQGPPQVQQQVPGCPRHASIHTHACMHTDPSQPSLRVGCMPSLQNGWLPSPACWHGTATCSCPGSQVHIASTARTQAYLRRGTSTYTVIQKSRRRRWGFHELRCSPGKRQAVGEQQVDASRTHPTPGLTPMWQCGTSHRRMGTHAGHRLFPQLNSGYVLPCWYE